MTDILWQDLRFALHSLRRARGFTIAALAMLMIGIGANTAIFSVLRAASLHGTTLPDPDRLAIIWTTPPGHPETLQLARLAEYFEWRDRSETFDAVGTMLGWSSTLGSTRDGEPAERIAGWRFSASAFRALGVKPQLGRVFTAAEDQVGAPEDIVIISDGLWRSRFGADPGVIGRTVLLDGQRTTIVGVMPPNFGVFDTRSDFWIPSPFSEFQVRSRSANRVLQVIARLKPGVSLQRAQADIERISAEIAREDPAPQKGRGVVVQPLDVTLFGNLRQLLGTLQAAVAFVLLIACANVAGLLLIRSASRQRDVAIRVSLGADRARIVRMFLVESLVLSACAGLLGLALAVFGVRAIASANPSWLNSLPSIAIDARVLVFTLIVSLLTGVAFGLLPALGAWSSDLVTPLKDRPRMAGGARGGRVQGALVVAQVTLTLVLLVGAGLLIKSFWHLQHVNLGMDPRQVLSFQTRLPASAGFRMVGVKNGFTMLDVSPQPSLIFERVRKRLEQIPGVRMVGGTNVQPAGGGSMPATIHIEGRSPRGASENDIVVNYSLVTPEYFSTMRIPVVRGREFTELDARNAPLVAVINESMSRRFWPDGNAIGQRIVVSILPDEPTREIVGVVADTPSSRYDRSPAPAVYVPHQQELLQSRTPYGQSRINIMYVLRIDQPLSAVVPAVRRAVAEIDTNLPVSQVEMVNEYLARQIEAPRDSMIVVVAFGVVAMLLALLGIYALVAYAVVQRTREIGIHLALGAGRTRVLRLVLQRSVLMTVGGVLLGLAGATLLTRYVASLLFDLTPLDASTFAAVAVLFIAIAAIASYVPAHRATRIDPLSVLRYE